MSILSTLENRVTKAFHAVGLFNIDPVVQLASQPKFGDYQINGVMSAAKHLKKNPRILAAEIVDHLSLQDIADHVEIAGPGFINIHLATSFLRDALQKTLEHPHLGIHKLPTERIMVEYSSPNLAKEMHVGHLRSTVIGDALARVLAFLGHEVVQANHVGDWGTQFGMLVAYLAENHETNTFNMNLEHLEDFYRKAKKRFDDDLAFADRARNYVHQLQNGDPEVLKIWQQFVSLSLQHCQTVYDVLGVSLRPEHVRGESAYNNDLPNVIADLQALGLLVESEGARVVFLPTSDHSSQDTSQAMIIQKKDGGYLYATTDIAAIRYRHQTLQLNRVLYVVDARQSLHFQQLFTLCRMADFIPKTMQLEHVAFGMMMGEDNKPFKTRTGDTIKLIDLLNEAQERAYALTTEKNPEMPEPMRRKIAHVIGIGAVKYADLSKSRQSDYVFTWSKMLAFEGNTAPYLLYAYTRIQSLLRQHQKSVNQLETNAFPQDCSEFLTHPTERALAVMLMRFEDSLKTVAKNYQPHHICTYLFDLATHFSRFYEHCPILKSTDALRTSRLKLAALTAKTLKTGLTLLGINVLDMM